MPHGDSHRKIARVVLAHTARVLAVAERWLRAADHLDYMIRRWLIPIPFGEGTRSMPHKEASMRSSVALSPVQAAIGQRLRAQYALERAMPDRLANLLREFEQRNNKAEAFARTG
jgi:hypothetical protein